MYIGFLLKALNEEGNHSEPSNNSTVRRVMATGLSRPRRSRRGSDSDGNRGLRSHHRAIATTQYRSEEVNRTIMIVICGLGCEGRRVGSISLLRRRVAAFTIVPERAAETIARAGAIVGAVVALVTATVACKGHAIIFTAWHVAVVAYHFVVAVIALLSGYIYISKGLPHKRRHGYPQAYAVGGVGVPLDKNMMGTEGVGKAYVFALGTACAGYAIVTRLASFARAVIAAISSSAYTSTFTDFVPC